MIAARNLEHVGHELGGDRCTGFVFLVLSCIREIGDDSSDAPRRRGFAGIDHDEKLHESVVDITWWSGLEYENCKTVSTHGPTCIRTPSVPSSSLTDSPIVTEVSWFEYCSTRILVSSIPSLICVSGVTCEANSLNEVYVNHLTTVMLTAPNRKSNVPRTMSPNALSQCRAVAGLRAEKRSAVACVRNLSYLSATRLASSG